MELLTNEMATSAPGRLTIMTNQPMSSTRAPIPPTAVVVSLSMAIEAESDSTSPPTPQNNTVLGVVLGGSIVLVVFLIGASLVIALVRVHRTYKLEDDVDPRDRFADTFRQFEEPNEGLPQDLLYSETTTGSVKQAVTPEDVCRSYQLEYLSDESAGIFGQLAEPNRGLQDRCSPSAAEATTADTAIQAVTPEDAHKVGAEQKVGQHAGVKKPNRRLSKYASATNATGNPGRIAVADAKTGQLYLPAKKPHSRLRKHEHEASVTKTTDDTGVQKAAGAMQIQSPAATSKSSVTQVDATTSTSELFVVVVKKKCPAEKLSPKDGRKMDRSSSAGETKFSVLGQKMGTSSSAIELRTSEFSVYTDSNNNISSSCNEGGAFKYMYSKPTITIDLADDDEDITSQTTSTDEPH